MFMGEGGSLYFSMELNTAIVMPRSKKLYALVNSKYGKMITSLFADPSSLAIFFGGGA